MARVYATPEQLEAWTGTAAPADAARRLARASEDVDYALLTARYEVDGMGMPTAPDVVQALADATCAQVEHALAAGGDTTGAAGQWDSVNLGPAAMSGRREGSGVPGVDLAPRAVRALRRAGLLPGVIGS